MVDGVRACYVEANLVDGGGACWLKKETTENGPTEKIRVSLALSDQKIGVSGKLGGIDPQKVEIWPKNGQYSNDNVKELALEAELPPN